MVAAVVVLAAGEGKRMHSATPKVLHEICGRSLLAHVLAAVEPLHPQRTLVVIGHGRDEVAATLPESVTPVVQDDQRGTGHATRLALEAAPDVDGTVLVLYADMPLLTIETLTRLLDAHAGPATVLTAEYADPTGYGRIVRDLGGHVTAIVEERDATPGQRTIPEINTGVYVFEAATLRAELAKLSDNNVQGEEYLTDVIGQLVGRGEPVATVTAQDPAETVGVNDRAQLAAAGTALNQRLIRNAQLQGATIVDPATTWLDATVRLEPDATVGPFSILRGATTVAGQARVGPYAHLIDTSVGAGAIVTTATADGAEIGPEATVGPYTYLRPGTRLARGAKAGGFVEMKNTTVGEGSKVPHLSYVGDTTIGEGTNVGAGTITCNYDGTEKSPTEIGDDVFVGSGTMLVAPVSLGDGSYVAAGSVITDDVPPDALGVGRAQQTNKQGWAARRRKPTDSKPDEDQGEQP